MTYLVVLLVFYYSGYTTTDALGVDPSDTLAIMSSYHSSPRRIGKHTIEERAVTAVRVLVTHSAWAPIEGEMSMVHGNNYCLISSLFCTSTEVHVGTSANFSIKHRRDRSRLFTIICLRYDRECLEYWAA